MNIESVHEEIILHKDDVVMTITGGTTALMGASRR
jgi:hypothetical protein